MVSSKLTVRRYVPVPPHICHPPPTPLPPQPPPPIPWDPFGPITVHYQETFDIIHPPIGPIAIPMHTVDGHNWSVSGWTCGSNWCTGGSVHLWGPPVPHFSINLISYRLPYWDDWWIQGADTDPPGLWIPWNNPMHNWVHMVGWNHPSGDIAS
jgi:hypothetical protein